MPTIDAFERPAPGPGDSFFEHMVTLAAEDRFDVRTAVSCRMEAAEHLIDLGYAEGVHAALQVVVDRESQIREELASG